MLRRPANNKHEFSDECGGRAGTTVNSKFIEKHGKLKTVVVSDCPLCVEKKVQNVRQYVPIVPQPIENIVLKCYRYYSKLKSSYQNKRRVTIFIKLSSSNNDKQDIAIEEYHVLGSHQKYLMATAPGHRSIASLMQPFSEKQRISQNNIAKCQ